MNNTNFRNDESNSIGILHYLKSRISDNATRNIEQEQPKAIQVNINELTFDDIDAYLAQYKWKTGEGRARHTEAVQWLKDFTKFNEGRLSPLEAIEILKNISNDDDEVRIWKVNPAETMYYKTLEWKLSKGKVSVGDLDEALGSIDPGMFRHPENCVGYETKVDEKDKEDPWEFNVSLADIVRNHEYINTIATRGVDSRKWESLAVSYLTSIAKELDCDLNKAMNLMDYVGYWAIPNRYKIKNSEKLKNYFLQATETQLAIWDVAKLLIDRTEETHAALAD